MKRRYARIIAITLICCLAPQALASCAAPKPQGTDGAAAGENAASPDASGKSADGEKGDAAGETGGMGDKGETGYVLDIGEWEAIDAYAERCYDDLIYNWWVNDSKGGHILHTWTGIDVREVPGGNPGGGIWERGMLYFALDSYYRATGDERALEKMRLESEHFRNIYTEREMASAGSSLHWACDDCGWHAWFYMKMYRYFGDLYYLDRAKALINNAVSLWLDDELGGGMWYDSEKTGKSLYTVAIVMASLDIYEHDGDESFYNLAVDLYDWMEMALKRDDGIYWMDLGADGRAFGWNRPDDIKEAGSVTGLGGNMAMAAIHARMYRLTGMDVFRLRALETMDGVKAKLVQNGRYINDRDAWTNTTFLMEWVMEVATLPGFDREHLQILLNTAMSVAENSRTDGGLYSGVWGGPPDDPDNLWIIKGLGLSKQIMTTCTTANLIMCAALYKNRYFNSVIGA